MLSKKFKVFAVLFFIFFSVFFAPRSFSNGAVSQKIAPIKENYIILTQKSLLESAELFANYHKDKFNTRIVTLSEIGSKDPAKIRAFLKAHFKSGFLLIIGNSDVIPRPAMYPSEQVHTNSFSEPSKTETDLYYALLSENIDKDGDGFPGELWDDRITIKPDLYVGRIPFNDNADVEKVFNNTVKFETKSVSGKAVLAGSFISYPGEEYEGAQIFNGDGAREEKLIGTLLPMKKVYLFNKEGSFPSVYPCDMPLNKTNFYSTIKGASFVDWSAHGSSEGAYNEVWFDKNKNGVPDTGDSFKFEAFVSENDDFKANGIYFSGSCLNEHGDDNLGTALLKKGAAAFIGSTEISFSPSYFTNKNDGGSASIKYYFVKNLMEGTPIGKALYNSFTYCFDNLLFKDLEDPVEGMLMNIYDFNLYGDPALVFRTEKNASDTGNSQNGNSQDSTNSQGSTKSNIFSINLSSTLSGKEITVSVTAKSENPTKKENLFILFPAKAFFVNTIPDGAILDKYFGMIRLNDFSGTFTFKGKVRSSGTLVFKVVQDNGKAIAKTVKANGFDLFDFNFDGKVNSKDLKILRDTFGKTYMDAVFNPLCDTNFDHEVNGKDLILFMQNY